MKVFGIITNKEKDKDLKYTRILIDKVLQKGGAIKLDCSTAEGIGMSCIQPGLSLNEVFEGADVIICLGGDGTFLSTARVAYYTNKPMLGINLGSLGFLTEVDKNDIEIAIDRIMKDEYEVEERMMLDVTISGSNGTMVKDVALNDVVVSKGALSRILHLKTYINNGFVDSFPGDGLIISSPTGSTAYSLSAGGPIVEPDVELMIVTPICPHILYSRSFIATGDRVVKVAVDEGYGHEAMVTVDGQKGYVVKAGDCIEIKKAKNRVKMLRVNQRNFFNVLRTKIYDRGEKLRKDEI